MKILFGGENLPELSLNLENKEMNSMFQFKCPSIYYPVLFIINIFVLLILPSPSSDLSLFPRCNFITRFKMSVYNCILILVRRTYKGYLSLTNFLIRVPRKYFLSVYLKLEYGHDYNRNVSMPSRMHLSSRL